jgi:outer membrane protein OmpA-like peptidoglycan-associated protein
MATSKPMLGGIELQQVQKIEIDEDQVQVQQSVPGLEGDFLQRLGRRATQISLTGVLTGSEAGAGLKTLQEKFRAAEPVSFVTDIATATKVDQVLIEELGMRELAGKPERFEYALTLREFVPPPKPKKESPPPPPPAPPSVDTGTLIVDVTVTGQPAFDFSTISVSVDGTQDDGAHLSRTIKQHSGNSWTDDHMPPGKYTVTAATTGTENLSGSADATIQAGQTTTVSITLNPGSKVAKTFIVHFRFDNAFVEPCMRMVLKQVETYAQAHSNEKLIIVGHTDLVGDSKYNQSLSERRARSVFAYLTFGVDATLQNVTLQNAALADWNALRAQRPAGEDPSIKDNWGVREYQHILQDLGYYQGNIDGIAGPQTDAAVRAFQQDRGLAVDGVVGDTTWAALIHGYLSQDPLSVKQSHFLPNCSPEILRWLGGGEQDPVKNTPDSWRPNRRTELIFVQADQLPCKVPQPVTFDRPAPGSVGSKWCLGNGNANQLCCFIARKTPEDGKFLLQPAEPGTITVHGSIKSEDGTPLSNAKYVLIAPDGEYMDGERPQGPDRGQPIPGRTDSNGTFSYPANPKGIGIYTLEIEGPFVARLVNDAPGSGKGNIICKRLDGSSNFDVIVAPAEQGDPRLKLHGTLFDNLGNMRKQADVQVLFSDGTQATATTDENGRFVVEMDQPFEVGKIRYNINDKDTVFFADFFIDVKAIDTDEGVLRRLHNLGYPAQDDVSLAITLFQATQGLNTTGEADQLTRSKLTAVHDANEPPVPTFTFSEEPLKPGDLEED